MGSQPDVPHGIAAALFTPVQARVLGLLFGQPDRRFHSAELIRLVEGGTGAVQRQLARLTDAGLVGATRTGNLKYYQARDDSPVFTELWGLVAKTIGLVEPIRQALSPLEARIDAAFIFGTAARGQGWDGGDIELMVLARSLDATTLAAALRPAEALLARHINPTVMTPRNWLTQLRAPHSVAKQIARGPRVAIIGPDADAG